MFFYQVYVAHGKLQLAMPMDKVKEISKLSLMVSSVPNLDLKVYDNLFVRVTHCILPIVNMSPSS